MMMMISKCVLHTLVRNASWTDLCCCKVVCYVIVNISTTCNMCTMQTCLQDTTTLQHWQHYRYLFIITLGRLSMSMPTQRLWGLPSTRRYINLHIHSFIHSFKSSHTLTIVASLLFKVFLLYFCYTYLTASSIFHKKTHFNPVKHNTQNPIKPKKPAGLGLLKTGSLNPIFNAVLKELAESIARVGSWFQTMVVCVVM